MADPESYTVKIQTDVARARVLIYDVPLESRIFVELHGAAAVDIANSYNLGSLDRTFAEATVDDDGILRLGDEVTFDG